MNSNCKGTIYSKTWEKDSYGLYDYEKNQVKSILFTNFSTGAFYRNNLNHNVSLREKNDNPSEQLLANLIVEDNKLTLSKKIENNLPINNQTLTDLQEQIWNVVCPSASIYGGNISNNNGNSNSNNHTDCNLNHKYELKINDIIKLGRIKFLVKDMNIVSQEIQKTAEIFIPYLDNDLNPKSTESICRICYVASDVNDSNDKANDNPIISVCKCKGTMHLHVYCLKKWLESKLTTTENNAKPVVSYTVKSFNCEICREPYPITIKNKDTYMHLINYNVPENQNYLILQSLNSIKENEYPLSIHVMMFIEDDSCFTLGRGHESDIRISDISVSRLHAKISMKDGKIFIEDKNSKFGTLVLAKEPVDLLSKDLFQVGRTLIYYDDKKMEEMVNLNLDSEGEDDGIYYNVIMNEENDNDNENNDEGNNGNNN